MDNYGKYVKTTEKITKKKTGKNRPFQNTN